MVLPNEILDQIDSFRSKDYFQNQVKRLAALPGSLYNVGLDLIGGHKTNEPYTAQIAQERKRKARRDLAALSGSDRQRLFAALAPAIAEDLEAAWQLFDRLPYTTFANRRPFRLSPPQSMLEALEPRCLWVEQVLAVVNGFEQPVTWFATWAAYLGWNWNAPVSLGILFAGAIDNGGARGEEVFQILAASGRGDHPTAKMGRHVVRGLLCAARPDGWDFLTRMLLAAQREEGLRQVILEAADEAHPDAFRRILRIIMEQNLLRFSAVVRAAAVWIGLPFEAAAPKIAAGVLESLEHFLDDPAARKVALESGSPEERYLALWCIAYADAAQACETARPLLQHSQVEFRFAAVYFLTQVRLPHSERLLLLALPDSDLRVGYTAFRGLCFPFVESSWLVESDLFEGLEGLFSRLPEKEKILQPIVWEWMTLQIDRSSVAGALVRYLGKRPAARLLPYLKWMDSFDRQATAKLLAERSEDDPSCRKALLELAADRDSTVHETVFRLLEKLSPLPAEIHLLEALLTRKTSSIRRGVIQLLLRQADVGVLESIDRLLSQRDEWMHLAGVDLLREMALASRLREECLARARRLHEGGLSEVETHILADLLDRDDIKPASLRDALGLANLDNLSQPTEPRSKKALFGLVKKVRLGSPAAAACILALDDLVDQHRDDPIQVSDWRTDTREELMGNVRWGLLAPNPDQSREDNIAGFQLGDVWEKWWQERPADLRDDDGLELLRAQAALTLLQISYTSGRWIQEVPEELRTYFDVPYKLRLRYESMVSYVLEWLVFLHPAPAAVDFLLDAVEEICYRYGQNPVVKPAFENGPLTHPLERFGYIDLARQQRKQHSQDWQAQHHARFWGLLRWLEEFTLRNGSSYRPVLDDLLLAHKAGAANDDDLLCFLLSDRSEGSRREHTGSQAQIIYQPRQFAEIHLYSGRHPHPIFARYPILQQAIERCRERILEVELRRGDLPTEASAPAWALRCIPGMQKLFQLLSVLGKADFERSLFAVGKNRLSVLSYLVRVTYPLDEDTPEAFTALARRAAVPASRLVALAVYAPQWARFVEAALGWQGLAEGVWWVYAHTKDRQWAVDAEIRETWAAQIGEYTPLSADALLDGAVDVAWFHRMYDALGEERWKEIYRVAAYASNGTGHTRARLFADAMLGKTSAVELAERVKEKRHQDSARALGLVPLPGDEGRKTELLSRYHALQEFVRTSKQFGSQRQASEKLAAAIGMENLSRTAGYADPQRLEWAMELEAVADLAEGPLTVEAEGVMLTLSIDALGEPNLAARRGERQLKSIPPAVKKNPCAAALAERKTQLDRQARRMRASLEAAMVRGDVFTASEVQALFGHPILRVMLEQLVFFSTAGMGYLVDGAHALKGLGLELPLCPTDSLRIAHPVDLLESDRWHDWQHECFIAERIQPFKQVFRELYLLTAAEREAGEKDGDQYSRRYAGQQVNPRQALALFGARGWVIAPEEGVFKTFHAEGLTARVGFQQTIFTPAEVEGLTIEAVGFTRRGDWQPLGLVQVPARLFSEVMRDVDLVVSVAHAGGIDPEVSASSIESRAALIKETCALLRIDNVCVENRHALVAGKLANYTIHLGSGTVHKQPGGALCIVPVHAQHRGRLFLPFVDDDPKTAELISKVLLLARDKDIKDPTILEQLLG